MKTLKLLSLSLAIASLAAVAHAQSGRPNYNPATETTMTGTVDSIRTLPSQGKGGGGLHLILTAANGPVEVHVGPVAFVSSKNMTFAKGDAVTVLGSKVTMAGQDVLLAREITKGNQVLTLRAATGVPLWAGRGGPSS